MLRHLDYIDFSILLFDCISKEMDLIGRDVIALILIRLPPISVIRLRRVCAAVFRTNHFVLLMRAHYPQAILTSDPKKQYIALTLGFRTYYKIRTDFSDYDTSGWKNPEQISRSFKYHSGDEPNWNAAGYLDLIPEQFLISGYVEDIDIVFFIEGLAIPRETKMWIVLHTTDDEYIVTVRTTKEALVEQIVLSTYDRLLTFHIMAFKETSVFKFNSLTHTQIAETEAFNEFLRGLEFLVPPELIPFTKENLYKHIMMYDYFEADDVDQVNNWKFMHRNFDPPSDCED
jgi:hypothetical protein